MLEFGSIVLTRFPFTDLSGSKFRPALVVSRDNNRRTDIVLAFITSRAGVTGQDSLLLQPSPENGLKVPSAVRFDKLATIEKSLVAGRIGKVDAAFLALAGPVFFQVFGFAQP